MKDTTNVLIDLHKKFLDSSNSSDSSRKDAAIPQLNSPKNNEKIEKTLNLSLNGIPRVIHNPKMFIPKLDLTQAKKIQDYNAKRTSPQVNTNLDNKLVEKMQK